MSTWDAIQESRSSTGLDPKRKPACARVTTWTIHLESLLYLPGPGRSNHISYCRSALIASNTAQR
ncbi:uncharacterized protein K489DRAFT_159814 [Dissoconium aciculare CBS 342.82]|uniref:Uncharacterized protein n=1 Tax=Dissoconium aciculare CBS 342.82 TaxID=1314786 RepID=A0A6J3MBW3_9PEZI|nr:uncharacterized protein K489DRAFT_159814 [Dissoconium aciculare CBS 342.82]KAF1825511.1 hypothetical protein K489DRAFT_159814 [Dissoconium aciculare CBS 342.82]